MRTIAVSLAFAIRSPESAARLASSGERSSRPLARGVDPEVLEVVLDGVARAAVFLLVVEAAGEPEGPDGGVEQAEGQGGGLPDEGEHPIAEVIDEPGLHLLEGERVGAGETQ